MVECIEGCAVQTEIDLRRALAERVIPSFVRGQGEPLHSRVADGAWRQVQELERDLRNAQRCLSWVTHRSGSRKGQLHLGVIFTDGASESWRDIFSNAKNMTSTTVQQPEGCHQVIAACFQGS